MTVYTAIFLSYLAMRAQLLDGKLVANLWQATLQQRAATLQGRLGRPAGLAVILLGHQAPSQAYVKRKQAVAKMLGINTTLYAIDEKTTTAELLALITQLNQATTVDGILVQLPLPVTINAATILDAIAAHKDVDGFHPDNLGKLVQRRPTLHPCTPLGIMYLLQHYQFALSGKKAVIVGASNIVGRPLAFELMNAGCTVTICHSKTQNLADEVCKAELLVSATGLRNLIDSQWIKSASIVIDVGIHRIDQQIIGDLDFTSAAERAGWITPVPGGIGPMTVAALMHNTLQAAEDNNR